MAISNSTAGRNIHAARRLKLLGGNLAIDCPVLVVALDEDGHHVEMDLPEILERLDDFEGRIGNMSAKNNIIACCFTAYKYGQFTPDERVTFEVFCKEKFAAMSLLDVAERALLNG